MLCSHAGDNTRERRLADRHVSATDIPDRGIGALDAGAGVVKRTSGFVQRAQPCGIAFGVNPQVAETATGSPATPLESAATKSGTIRAALSGSLRSGRHITERVSAASATLRVNGPIALISGLSPMPGTRPLVGLIP